ncbi:hypothetical protein TSUD_313230 [Trifolium subterraneum]|uniref:Uncharacterized protein n=1 Tax=Trifolium subterraneum TaxID=3900 RepID=A0A2Z6M6Z4_TRISU|nr:hypothetical protein TSUD_313230 [Trifolium subterraneum]
MITRKDEEEHLPPSLHSNLRMGVTLTPFHLTLPSVNRTRINLMATAPHNNSNHHRIRILTIKCVKVDAAETESATIMCEPCNGNGWLICDFCEGQKTNVKAQNNRIYRRCPSCKAVRYYYYY